MFPPPLLNFLTTAARSANTCLSSFAPTARSSSGSWQDRNKIQMFAFRTCIPNPTPNTGFKKPPEFTSPVVSATCVPTDRFPRIETQLAAQCPFARPTHPPRVNPNAHCLTHISQTPSQKLRQFDPGTIWTGGTIGSDLCFCSSMCLWIRRPSATVSSQSKPHLALPFIKS